MPTATTVVATSEGRYVRRAIDIRGRPQCLPMRPNEVVARAASVGAQDYSRVAIPDASADDLAATEFDRFRELAKVRGDEALAALSDTELLKALDLATIDGRITVGALLLFGRRDAIRRRLPTTSAAAPIR